MKNRTVSIYHFFMTLCMLLLSCNSLFAQKKSSNSDYAENVLLVKLKPQSASFFTYKTSIENIKNTIAPVALINYTRTFPTIQAPTVEGHVDLSLVYTLTFSEIAKADLPALATTLMTLDVFEYVELKYIHNQQAIFYPNDPNVPLYQQKYLARMGAFQAWAIEQGNPNVIIGIIDTGSDASHQDLTNNIAYNTLDPVNGVDDDNDGYIDNYSGWDFGNNDNNPTVGSSSNHGAKVSGIAGATANNGIGGAGMGFNSKILPLKASTDAGGGAIVAGYDAIVYAAEHGCKVINLSWGGTGSYSAFDQDVINYAAINNDVLIVAAAGNTDEEADYYPAAYDNVLSVIAMDTVFSPSANKYIDTRANFTNWICCYKATYSRSVDIGAQGKGLLVTIPTNTYTLQDGSSAASPVVAGAAALVRSHYPNISALQAAELLRVTADVVDTFPENAAFKEKMGKGRINIYKALTDTKSPSIRFKNLNVQSKNNSLLFTGDTVFVTADFFNYLRPTTGLTIDLSSPSNVIEVLNSISIGIIDSLTSKSNASSPLKFVIKNSATNNQTIELRIGYTDPATGYFDYQYFTIQVNPPYTTLYNDHVKTTITSNGRVGYQDVASTIGVGFESNGTNVLYEGGLMIGQNSSTVSDCVRGNPMGNSDLDFKSLINPTYIANSIKYKETFSKFNDSSSTNPLPQGIECLQRSYTFNTTALSTTVFLEYKIINRSNADIDSIYVGHFVDWDIQNYANNRAEFDYEARIGYAYDVTNNNLYAGLSLLTNQELHYYAMDNSNIPGTININPNDFYAYTKAQKFECLSSQTGRYLAGAAPTGNDISMSLAGRINHLKKGDTTIVAFALLTSNSDSNLKLQSTAAIQKFIEIHTGATPLADSAKICTNATSNFTISPSPGHTFNFYTEIPTSSSVPIFKGKSFTLTGVSAADTIYVTNTDSLYESTFSRFIIFENKAPIAVYSYTAEVVNTATLFTNESIRYQSVLWNFGDNQTSVEENPTHIYTIPGDYVVTLKSSDDKTCIDSIKHTITIVSNPLGITTSTNSTIKLFPIPADEMITLEFQQLDNTNIDIIVFNAMGQQVMQKNQVPIMNNQVHLSVATLETGLYFIQIKNKTSQLRFVKK